MDDEINHVDRRTGDRREPVRYQNMSAWERHGQTVIAGIALLLLGWVGLTVSDNAKGNAVMLTRITGLERQVSSLEGSLKANMADRYRGVDAERDFKAVYKELDRVRDDNSRFMAEQASRGPRIKSLETQIETIMKNISEIKMERPHK